MIILNAWKLYLNYGIRYYIVASTRLSYYLPIFYKYNSWEFIGPMQNPPKTMNQINEGLKNRLYYSRFTLLQFPPCPIESIKSIPALEGIPFGN